MRTRITIFFRILVVVPCLTFLLDIIFESPPRTLPLRVREYTNHFPARVEPHRQFALYGLNIRLWGWFGVLQSIDSSLRVLSIAVA